MGIGTYYSWAMWRHACKNKRRWGYTLQFHRCGQYEYAYHVSPNGIGNKIGVWSPEIHTCGIVYPAIGWVY